MLFVFLILIVSQLIYTQEIDEIFENIRQGMFMYFKYDGIKQAIPGDKESSTPYGVYTCYATELKFPEEAASIKSALHDNKYMLVFLGISNDNLQPVQIPASQNVCIIVHGKAVQAENIKSLPKSFIKLYGEYLGGHEKRNVLSGEYCVQMYVFDAIAEPTKIVIHEWLPYDVIIEKRNLFE